MVSGMRAATEHQSRINEMVGRTRSDNAETALNRKNPRDR
jgi:hypothetical protein